MDCRESVELNVVVLGAAGFLGGEIAVGLARAGHRVDCPMRPERVARDMVPIRLREAGCRAVSVDFNSSRALRRAFRHLEPEAVVDAAWAGVVSHDRDDPGLQKVNVERAEKLLDVLDHEITRIWVGLGSQAEYGRFEGRIDEDAAAAPHTEYGRAKAGVLQHLNAWKSVTGARLAWLRVFGVYGPHQPSGWLVPDAISALLRDDAFTVHSADHRFDYLYVSEVAAACRRVLTCPEASGIYNVGSGQAVSIRSIVTTLHGLSGSRSALSFGGEGRAPEHGRVVEADITKLRQQTGWSPRISLESGLERTLRWHREALGVHA